MWSAIGGLFKSKTFWLAIIGGAVCTVLQFMGVSAEIIAIVGGLFGVKGLQQAMSDFGKNAPK